MSMQRLVMTIILLLFMWAEYAAVASVNGSFPEAAGLIISACNAVVPASLHIIADSLEVHETEMKKLSSVFHKTSLFRYFNTAVIVYLLTDFNTQLHEAGLLQIQMVLVFDAFLTPALYFFDVGGYINRFIKSRLVDNIDEVDILMSGDEVRPSRSTHSPQSLQSLVALCTPPPPPSPGAHCDHWILTDRFQPSPRTCTCFGPPTSDTPLTPLPLPLPGAHLRPLLQPRQGAFLYSALRSTTRTDDLHSNPLAKTFFVGLFYLPVLPTGALLASAACAMAVLADRYGLLYKWRSMPQSKGQAIFETLSGHLALSMLMHILVASRWYFGWTYDSVCATHPSRLLPGGNYTAAATAAVQFYVCDRSGAGALAEPAAWMPAEQQHLVLFYRAVFLTVCAAGGAVALFAAKGVIYSLFVVTYEANVAKNTLPWSKVDGVKLYVPQVTTKALRYPLIACDRTMFDESHIPWRCRDVERWDVFKEATTDFADLLAGRDVKRVFGTCKVYVLDESPEDCGDVPMINAVFGGDSAVQVGKAANRMVV
jgi:hypothetical protein